MTDETLMKNGGDLIYLAACALHGKLPEKDVVSRMDLPTVYKLSRRHSMQAITCMAIERFLSVNGGEGIDAELTCEWKAAKAKAIRKIVRFDMERERLFSYMEAEGIWHMPLKGVVFQHLYPKLGMRQITDNDILFDKTYREALRNHMVEDGYEIYSYGDRHHDVYMKEPIYNFEMHVSLYSEASKPAWAAYYETVKDRLIKDEGNAYGYHFSDEDFYIYIITHAYKHFVGAGNGIRFLMDIYVCTMKLGGKLDRAYVDRELEVLGVREFEEEMRRFADKLFSADCRHINATPELLSEQEREWLLSCLDAGTFGTQKSFIEHRLDEIAGSQKVTKKTKLRYLMRRIFPDMNHYKYYFPFFYKHKLLLPIGWVYRLGRAIVRRHKLWRSEIKWLVKTRK